MALPRVSVLAVVTVALLFPVALAEEDGLAVHRWVGSADARVHVDAPVASPLTLHADVKGLCADVEPLLEGGISTDPLSVPLPIRDGVRETGVGGACFPMGANVNKTMRIAFQELITTGAILRAVVCVDVNGDGDCSAPVDHLDLCRLSDESPVSVWTGEPCAIFADPAAADPTIYFLVVAALEVDTSPTLTRGLAGYAFAYPAY